MVTGELHMPAKRIANEVLRKKLNRSTQTNTNGVRLRVRRPMQCPKGSYTHGCQSPLHALVPPASRLVCVELNPGPRRAVGKAKPKRRMPQVKKKSVRGRRAMPTGPNTMKIRRGTGRLGLSSNPSSGVTSRFNQTIEEDEYIADVNGSSGFATTAYNINPGNITTFPWGNRISQLYDKYDFQMLEFYYKRIASEFNTSASTGNVILSIDYNATDAAPTTLQQVLATLTKNVGMPCDEIIKLQADCRLIRDSPSKYVLVGAQPANTDTKTYNAGVLYVTTQGTGTSNTLGRLFVRYRCVLKEPVLEPSTVAGGAVHFSGTAPTTANNFATAALQAGGSPNLTGITAATNVITFPSGIPGNYLVVMSVAGSTSASALGTTGTTGITNLNLLSGSGSRDASALILSAAAVGSTQYAIAVYTMTVAVAGATWTITPSTLVGGNAMDLFIVSLPSALLTKPVLPPSARENALELRLKRLEALLEKDSEFEDETSSSLPYTRVKESPLTKSTVDLIGELVSRTRLPA